MSIDTLKQAARTAQQQEAKGLATKEQAASAQRAFDVARTQPQRDAETLRRQAEDDRQQAIWDSINAVDTDELRRQALELDCIRKVTVKGGPFKFYDVEVTRYCRPQSIGRTGMMPTLSVIMEWRRFRIYWKDSRCSLKSPSTARIDTFGFSRGTTNDHQNAGTHTETGDAAGARLEAACGGI